jgi:UDP-glucose 4-epimerase
MKRMLVTGASGPIGIALIKVLRSHGHEVTALINPESARNNHLQALGAHLINCSMDDYLSLELDKEFYAFIHLAWQGGKDRNSFDLNYNSLTNSLNAIDLAYRLGCHVFLTTGSQAEYGPVGEILSELSPKKPVNAFGACKLAFSELGSQKALCHGMRFLSAKVLSVYGTGDRDDSVISYIINGLVNNDEISLSDGSLFWDFLHSHDLAEAILALIENDKCYGEYIIGEGSRLKLKDYFLIAENSLSLRSGTLVQEKGKKMDYSLRCNVKKIKDETGWEPAIHFSDGIKMLYDETQRKKEMLK